MARFQRKQPKYLSPATSVTIWVLFVVVVVVLMWKVAWPAAAEMVVVSTTPIGPTAALCEEGTPGRPDPGRAFIAILDQPVWYTIHSATAVPSASLGALGTPGTTVIVDHATDFRAIRQGTTDARLYVVCIP